MLTIAVGLVLFIIFVVFPVLVPVLLIWQHRRDAPRRARDKRAREMLDRDRAFFKNS